MSEEKTAKLKLKRKKCVNAGPGPQSMEIKLQSVPVVDIRQSSTGSWFDKIDLTTAEQQWKQVLTSVSADIRSLGWGSLPGLPQFTRQFAGKGEKTTVKEVFEVGHQSFEWFSFPTALPPTVTLQSCTTDLKNETAQNNEHVAEPPVSKPGNQSPPPPNVGNPLEINLIVPGSKDYDQVGNKNLPQHQKVLERGATMNLKTPMIFQKSSKESGKAPTGLQKSSIKNLKVLQKGLEESIKDPQTSQKRSKKAFKGHNVLQKGSAKNAREPQLMPKQTLTLWPSVTSAKNNQTKEASKQAELPASETSECNDIVMHNEEEPVSAGGDTRHVMQESAEKATEAAGSLQNCPICLVQFPKQFSQLDMDSHLAQCLSETTVDVVW
ncbi:Fanconi anemia core complex-associated protein 20 [Pyxicephalus adspersus]|uniref:UBZ2-type domain-containing protein n=1 Tax=Pyxicephalus adspersus TaxID=30357 RepID=A0AAV2ZUN3_PYXAD|nr:TPA: hypothetical protein GDO54_003741 [Pyxicephalus adspersus]